MVDLMYQKQRVVDLALKRDELRDLTEALERAGVKEAMGLYLDQSKGPNGGTSGKALRRAINALVSAEMKARVDDAKENAKLRA